MLVINQFIKPIRINYPSDINIDRVIGPYKIKEIFIFTWNFNGSPSMEEKRFLKSKYYLNEIIYIITMETDSKVHDLLSKVKSSQDPNYTLYHHLQKLYQVKLELNNDEKFLDLFEDISLRIRKEGKYMLEDQIDKKRLFLLGRVL
jgi:hypothetical protein